MGEQSSVIYGLEYRARAVSSQGGAGSEAIRFLVGTQSFRGDERGSDNQIHLVEYDDERNATNRNIFYHSSGEIWHLSASPTDPLLFASCYNKITSDSQADMNASLWRLPSSLAAEHLLQNDAPALPAEHIAHLDVAEERDMKCVLWSPIEESHEVVTLGDTSLYLWDISQRNNATAQIKGKITLDVKGHPKFTTGRWDPHHRCVQVATANDCCLRGWDLRSLQQTFVIENAHSLLVRDLDVNPNRQYIIASCGDDCKTKFWDTRNPSKAIKTLDNHSHWVWSVRFNHFHDQLVLTASSDSRVILSNLTSISSEPYGKLVDDGDDDEHESGELSAHKEDLRSSAEPVNDSIVQVFEEHEDSVYSVEWSTSDPWVFASLSYDGRLVINHVPRTEKYRILL